VAIYHGRHGVVYLSTTGTGNASSVAKLTNWTLDMKTDKVDVTSFGDANKTYVQGLKDLSGTFAGFWQDSENTIFAAADSADGCKIYLYPSTDAPQYYWYGPAWLDASVETGVGDAVKVKGNFAANGSWGRKAV
jgi:hypothetical protein